MAGKENLRKLTTEQAREIGRKGGIASAESKKRKKLLKECLEELLERDITDNQGHTMTGAEAMSVRLFQKALKGDLKAFELVRDTAGQKPAEKVMMSDIEQNVIEEIEEIVEREIGK